VQLCSLSMSCRRFVVGQWSMVHGRKSTIVLRCQLCMLATFNLNRSTDVSPRLGTFLLPNDHPSSPAKASDDQRVRCRGCRVIVSAHKHDEKKREEMGGCGLNYRYLWPCPTWVAGLNTNRVSVVGERCSGGECEVWVSRCIYMSPQLEA
jgi:hypothetical protein